MQRNGPAFEPVQAAFMTSRGNIAAGDHAGTARWRGRLSAFLARNARQPMPSSGRSTIG